MDVVFLGSGSFAVPSLEALVRAGHRVRAAVSQPDREKGRGRAVTPPPVKPVAEALGIPVFQPARVRLPEAQDHLRSLSPDVQVVVAYGQILPRTVIDIPRLGTINVHASLLPRYRGAAPIQWAIVRGETETGVTTMQIDEGLDTGPILRSRATAIGDEETAEELELRLSLLGAELLLETLSGLENGSVEPVPQDHAQATLAPLITKEEGRIDWSLDAHALACRVRGFHRWPGVVTQLGGRSLRVMKARPGGPVSAQPGTVVAVEGDGVLVACGGGTSLRLLEVQPESRKPMPATAFAAGARLIAGARLG